jgi:hypothetical protein
MIAARNRSRLGTRVSCSRQKGLADSASISVVVCFWAQVGHKIKWPPYRQQYI